MRFESRKCVKMRLCLGSLQCSPRPPNWIWEEEGVGKRKWKGLGGKRNERGREMGREGGRKRGKGKGRERKGRERSVLGLV